VTRQHHRLRARLSRDFVAWAFALIAMLASGCTVRGRDVGPRDVEFDLSGWDFDSRGPVNLRARWEFLEGTLDVRTLDHGASGRLSVPWVDATSSDSLGRAIAPQSVGVARLRVKLPPHRPREGEISLYLPYVYSAAEWHVRIDRGEEPGPEIVRFAGKPGPTAESSVFQWRPMYVSLPVPEGATTLDMRVAISNFGHARFGIWQAPVIGTGNAITGLRIAEAGGEYLLIGLLLITAIHHFMIFALRKNEREPLWFGLFCTTVALRTLALRYAVQDIFPHANAYGALMRIEYGSVSVAPMFAALLVDGIVGGLPAVPLRAFLGAELVLTLCAATLPPVLVSGTVLNAAQLLVLPGGALMVGALVRDWRMRRSEESAVILGGYVLLVLCGVTDVLSSQQIIDVPLLVSWGLAIVVVSQSFVLARRNEQARARSEDLLDALTMQSIELERKNADLARVDALKDEFLANTSHELRTPLNGIIGLTEAMLDGSAGPLNPRAAQQLQLVVGAGRRLSALVDDVLDFAKLRHHELELRREPTDTHLHIELAIQLTRPLVKPGVALRTEFAEGLPPVDVDPNRIQQVLLNLLGNAAKYTHEGEIVVATARDGDRVLVTIRDTGIGVDADKIERIFRSFEQGDGGVSRRYGGTGLGLTIARELVELHGGTIRVESAAGKGSAFTFSVPVSTREVDEGGLVALRRLIEEPPSNDETPPPSSTLEARVFRGATILAVDDDETNLAVLAGQLEPEGYTVVTARDADEARAHLAGERKFDLAIIDVMMPGTSGYALCRELRTRFDPAELPILLLTARTQMQDLLEGFSAGASDYLHKPFSKRELRARIDAHLQVVRANAAYGKFVPRQILDLLGRTPQDLRLGDTVHRTATVVVFDFASLTGFADDDSAPEAVSRLNDFFASSSQRIRAAGGVLHGRTSQAMTVLFPEDPNAAVRVALRLVRECGVAFPIYAGVHHGEAIVAAVGDDGQIETSLLGDTERIASRLLGLTRVFGSHVVVSDDLLAALPAGHELTFRKLGRVQTKVSPDATVFHEVLDADDLTHRYAKTQMSDVFAQALAAYALGEFQRAGEMFAAILDRNAHDAAAEFYRDLCASYAEQGAHAGFEGEVVFDVL
jgi:two-component system sensor histidine kinase ChiS